MGNEFGHPEWIDFPREGNGWSGHYCRRQWSLVDNKLLRYSELGDFDRAMTDLLKKEAVFSLSPKNVAIDQEKKTVLYSKGDMIFVFNFSPESSYSNFFVETERAGEYRVILNTDDKRFGGFGRSSSDKIYPALTTHHKKTGFYCYLPSRSALVFKRKNRRKENMV